MRFILCETNSSSDASFFLLVCNDFDHEMEIISTKYQNFSIKIPRDIEPLSLTLFDFVIINNGIRSMSMERNYNLWISSRRDDIFFFDNISYKD